MFGDIEREYSSLQQQLDQPELTAVHAGQYLPYIDTLKTSLPFISASKDALINSPELGSKLEGVLQQMNGLENKRPRRNKSKNTYVTKKAVPGRTA